MGGTRSIYGRQKEAHTGFLRENLTEIDNLEYLGVDGKMTFK
jgi:hypothetical protein